MCIKIFDNKLFTLLASNDLIGLNVHFKVIVNTTNKHVGSPCLNVPIVC